MDEKYQHAKRMLNALLKLPGNIDDIASRLIELAKFQGGDATIECVYGNVILHARADSTIATIRQNFERECMKRFSSHTSTA